MIFNKLTIENFYSVSTEIFVDLKDQGLVVILGDNRDSPNADSNGAGKSTIFDAICWCLFGQTPRGLKGDEVINRNTKKNCKVSLSVLEGETTYQVTRYRKHKDAKKSNDVEILVNGQELEGHSVGDIQEKINEVLGLDFDTFCAMMPGALGSLAEMSDAQIKDLFETILQTSKIAEAHEHVKNQLKEVLQQKTLLTSLIDQKQKEVAQKKNYIEKLLEQEKEEEGKKERAIQEIERQIQQVQEELKDLELELQSTVVSGDTGPLEKKDEIEEDLLSLQKKWKACQKRMKGEELELFGKVQVHNQELLTIRKKIAKIKELKARCVSCNQTISEDHKNKQLSDLHEEEKECIRLLTEYEETLKEHQHSFVKKENRFNELEKELLEELHLIRQVEQKVNQVNLIKAGIEKEIRIEENNLKNLHARLEREHNSAVESTVQNIREDQEKALYEDIQTVDKYLSEVSELEKTESIYRFWETGFSTKGLRSKLLENVVPVLNSFAQKYCQSLTGGNIEVVFSTKTELKSGKQKEAFQISVVQKTGAQDYRGASAGEKARVDLILSLVLGDLAMLRSRKKILFRFFDEIFDPIDNSGIDAIMRLLEQNKDKYNSVFVVTHKADFQNRFEKTLTVVRENGQTRIEMNQ